MFLMVLLLRKVYENALDYLLIYYVLIVSTYISIPLFISFLFSPNYIYEDR